MNNNVEFKLSGISKEVLPNKPQKKSVEVIVNKNCVIITLDQLVAYHNLPKKLLDIMPGYKLMSSIGVEFTNIHNNRQSCSASRSSYTSSQINTGIQDNIDRRYQYNYVSKLPLTFNTVFKSAKKTLGDSIITSFFGKEHLQSAMATTSQTVPLWNLNTSGCLRQYGVDRYNVFGDPYYVSNHGTFSDNMTFEFKMINTTFNCDYVDKNSQTGYIGAYPFLRSRSKDNHRFLMNVNFINPHDTQECWSNISQTPTSQVMTFWTPYMREQVYEAGTSIPYKYSDLFSDANYKSKTMTTNYFSLLYPKQERNFNDYKTNANTLPFKASYQNDYVMSSTTNNLFPYFIASYQTFISSFTHSNDSSDLKTWKNLINNYYSLVCESDLYVYKLLTFMKNSGLLRTTSVIIMSDHGDSLSAHGLKQKQTHYKESVNVPFIVYSPLLSRSIVGKKSNILGSLLDLAPTINVLLGLPKEPDFAGVSLLKWSKNKLVIRPNNVGVLNIYNSWMTSPTYLFYKIWYNSLTTVPDNIICTPNSFIDYICNFVMTIDYYKGKLYKFVRYFNLVEYLIYNSIFNEIFREYIYYTTVNNDFQTRFLSILDESVSVTYSAEIAEIVIKIQLFPGTNRSFQFMFDFINDLSVENNETITLLFVYITVSYLNTINPNMYGVIPGSKSQFSELSNNLNYYHFCHNLTDDPDEIINMCDTNNYSSDYDDIFSYFNNSINSKITQYNMDKFIYIIPSPILLYLIKAIKTYGTSYELPTAQTLTGILSAGGDD